MRWIVAVLIFACLQSQAAARESSCEHAEPSMRFSEASLSLAKLERIGYQLAAANPKAPQVPFAYAHKDWLWLKANYRFGDRILKFEGPLGHDGQPFAWGYALFRGQCFLGLLTTHRA